ncbi:hypothetical protein EAL2_c19490 [Peptoclostridium acidaminophilum DSM 3953]|uniref:Uncharacterized protein n=1 Tax=Peptoclostridium acidaminophilum DSM 3953 TaxID=1286171 RepID=W8T8P2_PEPAC|nr:hypothetical protein EAL2_c19490 [Peptoclostridium acidaminophilum DSM 3953]
MKEISSWSKSDDLIKGLVVSKLKVRSRGLINPFILKFI